MQTRDILPHTQQNIANAVFYGLCFLLYPFHKVVVKTHKKRCRCVVQSPIFALCCEKTNIFIALFYHKYYNVDN